MNYESVLVIYWTDQFLVKERLLKTALFLWNLSEKYKFFHQKWIHTLPNSVQSYNLKELRIRFIASHFLFDCVLYNLREFQDDFITWFACTSPTSSRLTFQYGQNYSLRFFCLKPIWNKLKFNPTFYNFTWNAMFAFSCMPNISGSSIIGKVSMKSLYSWSFSNNGQ